MPVLGVASKLRQPAVGSKPVHTAVPIPNLGIGISQHCPSRPLEFATPGSSTLSCQLTLESTCEFGEKKALQRTANEREDSKMGKVKCKGAKQEADKSDTVGSIISIDRT
ncbi:hypothetical protein STEG23_013049 [Scotinomys teguina]